jgi:hypothetical protein
MAIRNEKGRMFAKELLHLLPHCSVCKPKKKEEFMNIFSFAELPFSEKQYIIFCDAYSLRFATSIIQSVMYSYCRALGSRGPTLTIPSKHIYIL